MQIEAAPESYIYTTFQRTISTRERIAGIRSASELLTEQDRLDQYRRLKRLVYSTTPVISIPQGNSYEFSR